MKLRFKHQAFQSDAASAVVGVFRGQPLQEAGDIVLTESKGFGNRSILLSDEVLTLNIREVQQEQGLHPIDKVKRDDDATLALNIEMETGTGKTYTYIKTIHELHKHYGWIKFVVVVPSVAIREGVVKGFEAMADHFAEEYGKRIQYFVYDSACLTAIDQFALDAQLHVMVINTQAFNVMGKDARLIKMKLESFSWRRPIDVIAEMRPILIIDEPQSVLGTGKSNKTRQGLADFQPLFTILYSATHRRDDIYNQLYRLDAIDAFNKRLVKKIEVIGVERVGTTGSHAYLYLDSIVLAKQKGESPRARISFDVIGREGLRVSTRLVGEGFNLYSGSGKIKAYRNGYIIERIDGRKGCIRLSSGEEIYEGQAIGLVTEEALRRIQIRTTIQKHLEREQQLYRQGIKVLSLFFIDAVDKYRIYEAGGEIRKGPWAAIFEEEYVQALREVQDLPMDEGYRQYLKGIRVEDTHAGYFSQDKKGKMVDSTIRRGETASGDTDAYQLIMRNKEQLLSLTEPIRFIFSHSALKEGWDNPNVFQICTLKQSDSEVKKRQEVGRGMRLCVNQQGERQDSDLLGDGVHDTNILTIIASESYKEFSLALQKELAEGITSRAVLVTPELFVGETIVSAGGARQTLSLSQASDIMAELILAGYVEKQKLTDKYFDDKKAGMLQLRAWTGQQELIFKVLDKVFSSRAIPIDNGRSKGGGKIQADELAKKEFQELWQRINSKAYCEVDFETEDLIQKSINGLNALLHVTELQLAITSGVLSKINSKEELEAARAVKPGATQNVKLTDALASGVKYDLAGELVQRTGLKRSTIVAVLQGIGAKTFGMYRQNPEEFIIRASHIINDQKAIAVIKHIAYYTLEKRYEVNIFSGQQLRRCIGSDAVLSERPLYDLIVADHQSVESSSTELLHQQDIVEVYTKLPRDFYINTPVGRYNPDWAIVFREAEVKHIYFVAEAKGTEVITQLHSAELANIHCASRHFTSILGRQLKFAEAENYEILYNRVMQG